MCKNIVLFEEYSIRLPNNFKGYKLEPYIKKGSRGCGNLIDLDNHQNIGECVIIFDSKDLKIFEISRITKYGALLFRDCGAGYSKIIDFWCLKNG